MELNKYQERIFETGRKKNAQLVLPEIGDPRVSLAKRKLSDFGFKLIEISAVCSRKCKSNSLYEYRRYGCFCDCSFK